MKRRGFHLVVLAISVLCLSGGVLGGTAALHRSATQRARELDNSQGLYCALQADPLAAGSVIAVRTRQGRLVHSVSIDQHGHALLGPLPARNVYLLQFPDGEEGSFFLGANASVTALSGALRDDGEILYYSNPDT